MKQKFVNATINDRRKGKEQLAQTPQPHPLRETVIGDSQMATPRPMIVAKPKEEDPAAKLRADVEKILSERKKAPKAVPKSRILGMSAAVAEPEPVKDYADILTMLLAKK
jgi:hypothetical protein